MSQEPQPIRSANQLRFSFVALCLIALGATILGLQKLREQQLDSGAKAEAHPAVLRSNPERDFGWEDGETQGRMTELTPRVSPSAITGLSAASASVETNIDTATEVGPRHDRNSDDSRSGGLAARGGRALSADDLEMALVYDIHKKIVANHKERRESEMRPYKYELSAGRDVAYSMLVVKSGFFTMGSPESEQLRQADESPQHPVLLDAFWMQECEVRWNEYELFMYQEHRKQRPGSTNSLADAVAFPTKPYVEMSFGMGKADYPAICMTQHAANKYCQWLSARTGHFYRLPTEAEWEYACRANSKTAYSFGSDPAELDKYAWFAENSDFKYQKVGKKLPNAWGLYDMHGNVAEWCLDQYAPYGRSRSRNPWNKATQPFPHVVRGGGWDDDADKCRSAARRGSDVSWKLQDPFVPRSLWYLTDGQFVGFRIVRPLRVPSAKEMYDFWNSGVEIEPTPVTQGNRTR